MPFLFVLIADRRLERFFFLRCPCSHTTLQAIPSYRCQDTGGLLASHDGNTGIGPHKQQSRSKGPATHAVVARTKGATNNNGEFRDGSIGYGSDHFGAMAGSAFIFIAPPYHEASNILWKYRWDFALTAQFNKVGAFLGGLGEQNAVSGND